MDNPLPTLDQVNQERLERFNSHRITMKRVIKPRSTEELDAIPEGDELCE